MRRRAVGGVIACGSSAGSGRGDLRQSDAVDRVAGLLDVLALQVDVGQRIRVDQLLLETPCDGWSVREVMNHSIAVTRKFAEFASGATARPVTPEGDHVGDDHREALRSCHSAARTAWRSADMARACTLPFGVFPSDVAAGINLFDALAHAWDMATAVGAALECSDALWSVGLDSARTVIGDHRDPAHYAPATPVDPGAGPREQFLGFLGRAR